MKLLTEINKDNICTYCLGKKVSRRCPACGTHTGTHWHDWCPPMEEKICQHCNGTGIEPNGEVQIQYSNRS